VLVDVEDMAAQMEAADVAIAAGGATTWERCVLGLPSIEVAAQI
jgi:UDP-2,4-diacetamido-2,4,6-trideoxy-beta-L-altropyranose hydrolase